jgi:ribosomal protein S18 acetylase RimI-like enzyme
VSTGGAEAALLERIEAYADAAPRPSADVEEIGAFTLFVSRIPWRLYARPRLGLTDDVGADDVAAVRERQRELGVREAFEWVHETTPSMAGAAEAAGLAVLRVPLLALDVAEWTAPPAPAGMTVRLLASDDAGLQRAQGVVELAFAAAGTARGDAGPEERDAAARAVGELGFMRDRLRRRLTVMAVAEDASGPVAAGSHQPVGDVSEVVGVGTLPSARRLGAGAAVTGRLVEDARERGAALVFLSAADADVARLYGRLGFRPLGTACFGRPAAA